MTNTIPNITLINAETGLQETRVMTTEEFGLWKESADRQNALEIAAQAKAETKLADKEAIAAKLGLTSEELAKLFA